jgi:hypothetical protein
MTETTAKELRSYPKIYNMGHPYVRDLFEEEVVIQEKIDGSQFSFGRKDGQLFARSKGAMIYDGNVPDLFRGAYATAKRLFEEGFLGEGVVWRGEAIERPKHNSITYGRTPIGNVILFDIDTGLEDRLDPERLAHWARLAGLESVPVIYKGRIESREGLDALLDRESILGGAKIEGIVVKNYHRFNPMDGKQLMGKLVSEAFKELHEKDWGPRNPARSDIVQQLIQKYRHVRRWEKAVERLRDNGQLEGSPRDIGLLMKEVPADIRVEEEHAIKEALFKFFWPQIERGVRGGLPEWYKDRLVQEQFADEDELEPLTMATVHGDTNPFDSGALPEGVWR